MHAPQFNLSNSTAGNAQRLHHDAAAAMAAREAFKDRAERMQRVENAEAFIAAAKHEGRMGDAHDCARRLVVYLMGQLVPTMEARDKTWITRNLLFFSGLALDKIVEVSVAVSVAYGGDDQLDPAVREKLLELCKRREDYLHRQKAKEMASRPVPKVNLDEKPAHIGRSSISRASRKTHEKQAQPVANEDAGGKARKGGGKKQRHGKSKK